ncbi:uncharacterized membrane protein At3g27390-like [Andrographis paniculata]|uniref:uncharacterized membrane protein At3g27390-like n=1 Tax=Andrographis paniculata TaxID=175694 RepID=UPI0021E7FD72|nr:uncharacterized membrane protein At3g27390-like [Andrographis paniculata]
MEPPSGFWASLWHFILFLPFFIGLLILGFIKGIIMLPVIFIIMSVGISVIILGLWPVHCYYTYYCIWRTEQFGPSLKMILCIFVLPVILLLWPLVGIAAGLLAGAAYGLLAPMFATFQAVEEGKIDKFHHCICDGIWSSLQGSFTIVRDFLDVCYYSYFSIMTDLQNQGPQEGKYYEIRLVYVPLALVAGICGAVIDLVVISSIAVCKSPYMLVKGWHRLFHDCIGREGPFLETICVPFAGLAILLWPLSVIAAVLGSVVSSIFLGGYAAAVVYQEGSFWFGLCYVVASLSIYDDYSNDILGMPEGSCFPRPRYRKSSFQASSLSKQNSSKNASSCRSPINASILELKPMELSEALFDECQRRGEILASKGIITVADVEDAKNNNKDASRAIAIGLPAYCIFQALLRSTKANSTGILLSDGVTEITSSNRPRDKFFDLFLTPLLIVKEQMRADDLSEAEEEYLGGLILTGGDTARLENSSARSGPESELRRAELDALARRLQGITKSISRFPTFRRRFESSISNILEELAKKRDLSIDSSSNGSETVLRSRGLFEKIVTTSFPDREAERDVEIGQTGRS